MSMLSPTNARVGSWRRGFRLLLAGLLALAAPLLWAQQAGEDVVLQGEVNRDTYAAGPTVDVEARVDGDLVVAGGRVTVRGTVQEDLLVAGGNIDVRATIQDDIRAAGGSLTFEGNVGGDLVAAGGELRVVPGTQVAGRVWLAGGRIEMNGVAGEELRAAGGSIVLGGQVGGDVELNGQSIRILPSARIAGNLLYRSPNRAEIAPEAQITGNVTYQEIDIEGPGAAVEIGSRIAMFLSLLVAGVVIYLLFPDFTLTAARTIWSDPGKSIGVGILLFIGAPLLGILLLVTVLGIPLGFMVFAAYLVALLVGYLIAMFFVGDALLNLNRSGSDLSPPRRRGVLALLVGALVLAVLLFVPFVGGFLGFLALLFGLGALLVRAYRAYRIGEAAY